MNFKTIEEIIDKEIEWSLNHPADNLSKQFQEGFVSGLSQAKNLLKDISILIKEAKK